MLVVHHYRLVPVHVHRWQAPVRETAKDQIRRPRVGVRPVASHPVPGSLCPRDVENIVVDKPAAPIDQDRLKLAPHQQPPSIQVPISFSSLFVLL